MRISEFIEKSNGARTPAEAVRLFEQATVKVTDRKRGAELISVSCFADHPIKILMQDDVVFRCYARSRSEHNVHRARVRVPSNVFIRHSEGRVHISIAIEISDESRQQLPSLERFDAKLVTGGVSTFSARIC